MLPYAGLTGTRTFIADLAKGAVKQGASAAIGVAATFFTAKARQAVRITLAACFAAIITALDITDSADLTVS